MIARETESQQAAPPSQPTLPYLTEYERLVLRSLADVIVPSDDLGPGAEEADLLPAFQALFERMPPDHRSLYRSGLQAFDNLARRRYGQSCPELSYPSRLMLLTLIERAHECCFGGGGGVLQRVRRRCCRVVTAWRGYGDAPLLYPHLVRDTLDLFYGTPTAWEWLAYTGPPFPHGWYTTHLRGGHDA